MTLAPIQRRRLQGLLGNANAPLDRLTRILFAGQVLSKATSGPSSPKGGRPRQEGLAVTIRTIRAFFAQHYRGAIAKRTFKSRPPQQIAEASFVRISLAYARIASKPSELMRYLRDPEYMPSSPARREKMMQRIASRVSRERDKERPKSRIVRLLGD